MEPYSSIVLIQIALVTGITVVLISLFFTDFEVCIYATKELSTVSGYYGPGGYLAFLATSLSAIICYEWLRPLRLLRAILKNRTQDQVRRDNLQAQVLKEEMPGPYDAAYVAMMAYVAIAYGDIWAVEYRGANWAQAQAAFLIVRRSINTLAGVARCGIAVDSLLFRGGRLDYSTARFWSWVVVPYLCQYPWFILGIYDLFPIAYTDLLLVGLVVIVNGIAVLQMIRTAPLIALFIQPTQTILFEWLYSEDCGSGMLLRSIFPVGSSSLSDLDQAAALATGLLVALWPLVTSDIRRDLRLALGIGDRPSPAVRTDRAWIRNRATF
jgi:hypothetical protein